MSLRNATGEIRGPGYAGTSDGGRLARGNSELVANVSRFFEVPFSSEGFAAFVPRRAILKFSPDELAHALFVTGRAPGDQQKFGDASVWEWLHRTSLVPAYVRLTTPGDRLVKSSLADSLDRSEKVALSYALGQAMTAIFCRHELGVRFLMHVDRYASRWRLDFGNGRRRPDLFGRIAAAKWVVAESKGRSNKMEPGLRHALRVQKGMIKSIAGHAPAVALGCVASFVTLSWQGAPRMHLDVFDPEVDEQSVALDNVSDERFLRTYYEPFMRAIDAGRRAQSQAGYITSELTDAGVRVGMREEIYEAMNSDELLQGRLIELVDAFGTGGETSLGDGTLVEVEWDSALSLQDYYSDGSSGFTR